MGKQELRPAIDFYRKIWIHGNKSNGRYELLCSYGTTHYPTKQWGRCTLKTFDSVDSARNFLEKHHYGFEENFFSLVKEMRERQKEWFKYHNPTALRESKRLERIVDKVGRIIVSKEICLNRTWTQT